MALEPHPLNRDFTWRPPASQPAFLSHEQVRQFDEEGYFLIERAFSPQEIDAVTAAIDPFEAKAEAFLRRQEGGRLFIARADEITFTVFLVTRSRVCADFSRHPVFAGVCGDLIGPAARLYHDQAVYKKPGAAQEFPWHQDNGYAFLDPQQYVTCWVALSDATLNNGCPWVKPRVHRMGTLAHTSTDLGFQCLTPPVEGAIAVPAAKGDIVVFSSLTPHRTGPNLTDAPRKSYILQYAPDAARVRKTADDPGALQQDPLRQYRIVADDR